MSWKVKTETVMSMIYRMGPHSSCTECSHMHDKQNVVTFIMYALCMWLSTCESSFAETVIIPNCIFFTTTIVSTRVPIVAPAWGTWEDTSLH